MTKGDAAEHAEEIVAGLEPWKGPFESLGKIQHRQGRLLQWTIGSVIAHVALTIAILIGFLHLNALQHESLTQQRDAYNTCLSGNAARDTERHTWNYVLGLAKAGSKSPSSAAQIVNIQKQIDTTLADRHCVLGR